MSKYNQLWERVQKNGNPQIKLLVGHGEALFDIMGAVVFLAG